VTDEFAPLTGELSWFEGTVADPGNGCIRLRTDDGGDFWVIWPKGTRDTDEGSSLRLENGDAIEPGIRMAVHGQTQPRSALPDGDVDSSMWGSFAGFCLGATASDHEFIRAETAQYAD